MKDERKFDRGADDDRGAAGRGDKTGNLAG
jgi:hypothetical protein